MSSATRAVSVGRTMLLIPMRGNEYMPMLFYKDGSVKLLIPMRGNEVYGCRRQHRRRGKLLIPMRGNEPVESVAPPSPAERY